MRANQTKIDASEVNLERAANGWIVSAKYSGMYDTPPSIIAASVEAAMVAAMKREALQYLAHMGGIELANLGINVDSNPSEGPTRGPAEPEMESAGFHDFASLVNAK